MLKDSDDCDGNNDGARNVCDVFVAFLLYVSGEMFGFLEVPEGIPKTVPFPVGVAHEKLALDENIGKGLAGVLIGYLFDVGN